MSQGSRPDRVADQIRHELATMQAREVHDPGVGFVTITRVQVTPDLQHARVYYTALGDERVRRESDRALQRAVKGMLPKGPLGYAMLRKLKIYADGTHPHTAQQPKALEI